MARSFYPSPVRVIVPALAFLVFVISTFQGPISGASAQSVFEAAVERHGPVTPDKRQELLEQLQAHAAVLEAQSGVVKSIVKLVGPTVVHIEADVTDQSVPMHGRRHFREEAGSGVIVRIANSFYVLTNRHVVNGAAPDKIEITLADGRPVQPLQVWTEMQTDVAVLKIEATGIVAADVGNSDALEIGDFVLAMGSPFGLSHSVTFGIVSAKGRRDLELGSSVWNSRTSSKPTLPSTRETAGGPSSTCAAR